MIKAVIFDLDGLLIDSQNLWFEADRLMLIQRGIDYHDELKEKIRGRGQKESAHLYINYFNLKESVDDIIKSRWEYLYPLLKKGLKLMPGAKDLVEKLYQTGFVLGLATGGYPRGKIEEILKKFSLKNFFKVIIASLDVKRGKPFPDIYLLTARKLGVEPLNCLVLEDAENGVMAAKAAGMKVIGVNPGPKIRQRLGEADLVVKSLEEVDLKLIKRLENGKSRN